MDEVTSNIGGNLDMILFPAVIAVRPLLSRSLV